MTDATKSAERRRLVQSCLLLWVDASIDATSADCQNALAQLRAVVNDVTVCTEVSACSQFFDSVTDERVFVITSGFLGQQLVAQLHGIARLDAMYIFCGDKSRHKEWTTKWTKIKGVYTTIEEICEALQVDVKRFNRDSIVVSFVRASADETLDQLEPSFMYTKIFKEILLELKHDPKTVSELVTYCRKLYPGNATELEIIDEFERDYDPQRAVWWYTRECFTYQMLNRALRTLDSDRIIRMGFFIRDLDQQVDELHRQQLSGYRGQPFLVYRGQGLASGDFKQLQNSAGGLMSFNNFLSTSKKRDVSFEFAESALINPDMVGILFVLHVDPSVSSVPFAAIDNVSYFQVEEEVLFSMHTVFRVGTICQMSDSKPLYQVELQLTSDDDRQLRALTERFQEEAAETDGWSRLGNLLLKIGHFQRADELYMALLDQTGEPSAKAMYYNQLGYIKKHQDDFDNAIVCYQKAIEIEEASSPIDPILAVYYSNVGGVHFSRSEYSQALAFFEKALEIKKQTLSPDDPSLATSYNNIGGVYHGMDELSKALTFYEAALQINEKILPANHPTLATSYGNLGVLFCRMTKYAEALLYHEKAVRIEEQTLPPQHPSLAASYENIGWIFRNTGDCSKALSYYERALDIWRRILPATHQKIEAVQHSIVAVRAKI